jgi:hypothetical protein
VTSYSRSCIYDLNLAVAITIKIQDCEVVQASKEVRGALSETAIFPANPQNQSHLILNRQLISSTIELSFFLSVHGNGMEISFQTQPSQVLFYSGFSST